MFYSLLFFTCILVNTGFILYYLLPALTAATRDLGKSLRRCRLYLSCRLDESREIALRQRCLKMSRQAMRLILVFSGIAIAYLPSLLFAHYHSGLSAAFVSWEALSGMTAAAVGAVLLRCRA